MSDECAITPSTAVALLAAHLAQAIREASSTMREQRNASNKYQRARAISERISRDGASQTPIQPGNEQLADQALGDIQALSDGMRHLAWLCSAAPGQRQEALTFYRRVIEVLSQRFGEQRSQRYHFDPHYLGRCLDVLEA